MEKCAVRIVILFSISRNVTNDLQLKIMSFLFLFLLVSFHEDVHAFRNVKFDINEIDNDCTCVPKEMCLDNDATINGEGLLDIR